MDDSLQYGIGKRQLAPKRWHQAVYLKRLLGVEPKPIRVDLDHECQDSHRTFESVDREFAKHPQAQEI